MDKLARIRFVAQRAMVDYSSLPPKDRIELLLGVAAILPKAEAEAALHAVFVLREAEIRQLKFAEMLGRPESH